MNYGSLQWSSRNSRKSIQFPWSCIRKSRNEAIRKTMKSQILIRLILALLRTASPLALLECLPFLPFALTRRAHILSFHKSVYDDGIEFSNWFNFPWSAVNLVFHMHRILLGRDYDFFKQFNINQLTTELHYIHVNVNTLSSFIHRSHTFVMKNVAVKCARLHGTCVSRVSFPQDVRGCVPKRMFRVRQWSKHGKFT